MPSSRLLSLSRHVCTNQSVHRKVTVGLDMKKKKVEKGWLYRNINRLAVKHPLQAQFSELIGVDSQERSGKRAEFYSAHCAKTQPSSESRGRKNGAWNFHWLRSVSQRVTRKLSNGKGVRRVPPNSCAMHFVPRVWGVKQRGALAVGQCSGMRKAGRKA